MIKYSKHKLENGLTVIVHQDLSVQIAVLNIIYNVGSKDETADKTGFAHLFEHLMFGGSTHCLDFDSELQNVGGENNAFTSTDVTNYYMTVPASNIETAFWLESDRMENLLLNKKSLEVQRKVVIEEFKQRYLNQPYGDVWLKLRPLVYGSHSYSWATIGKEIKQIEDATLDDVAAFHKKYYSPNNATLVLGGNISEEKALEFANKYFGQIKSSQDIIRNYGTIPTQTEKKTLTIAANVPQKAIYMVYHMPDRMHQDYYAIDLLSDVLGRGNSSRLYKSLVLEKQLMTSISASLTGSFLPGLFVISGRINDGHTFEEVEKAINEVICEIQTIETPTLELQKVKNQAEASIIFDRTEVLERCISIAYADLLGDTDLVNKELDLILNVTAEDIKTQAIQILKENNCSVLYYDTKPNTENNDESNL